MVSGLTIHALPLMLASFRSVMSAAFLLSFLKKFTEIAQTPSKAPAFLTQLSNF
jgi:hypothetical protein